MLQSFLVALLFDQMSQRVILQDLLDLVPDMRILNLQGSVASGWDEC